MRVQVRLFANYREKAGFATTSLELPSGATVADAKAALEAAHPALDLSGGMAAVNENLARADAALADGDELAFLPPVSGGEADDRLELTEKPLEERLGSLVSWATLPHCGAVVSFAGTTRTPNKGREVLFLEYEAYGPMAEKTLALIAAELRQRWELGRIAIVHRLGRVDPAETSLLIVVSAPHRPEAFEAARYALERIKKVLPVWKKEHLEGGEVWVEGAVDEDYRL